MRLLFFVDYKNRLIFLSCDILRISLIYVFAASKYSYCKLIKQSNQPIHTFFSHFCTYLFYIEGNGKEGKIHEAVSYTHLDLAGANAYANQALLSGTYLGYQVYSVPTGELLIGMDGKLNPKASIGPFSSSSSSVNCALNSSQIALKASSLSCLFLFPDSAMA